MSGRKRRRKSAGRGAERSSGQGVRPGAGAGKEIQQREAPPFPDRDFVDREFTPERIETEGRRQLYRAINTRQVVGFIGSGIASSFGRPSWSKLIRDTYLKVLDQPDDGSAEQRAHVKAAAKDVDDVLNSDVSDPDLLPLFAQLIRSLAASGKVDGDQDDAVQAEVKRMTRDDDQIARSAWSWLGTGDGKKDDTIDRTWWRWLDSARGLHVVLAFLERSPGVDRKLGKHLADIRRALGKLMPNLPAKSGPGENFRNRRLCEEERVLASLLIAVADVCDVLPDLRNSLARIRPYKRSSTDKDPCLGDSDSERSSALDPVRLIFEDLHIRRLITTNYDFELERGLERLGFQSGRLRPPSERGSDPLPDALEAERPNGTRAHATVFNARTAADLVGFATNSEHRDYEVFHIHGRAADGAHERLVITEPDYQAIYMRDSAEAHLMNEALTAVMAGNPLMFIGIGMQEADFLRPLRQFAAGPGARINRAIVAFLPTEESAAQRTRTALKLYLRYGVHTIFYGFDPKQKGGWVDAPRESDGAGDSPLFQSIEAIRSLKRIARGERIPETGARDTTACRKAIGIFGRAHANEDELLQASLRAADELLGRLKRPGSRKEQSPLERFLSEADSRIRTRALCAGLLGLETGREKWWNEWLELPRPRTFSHTVEVYQDHKWSALSEEQGKAYLDISGDGSRTTRNIRYRIADFQHDHAGAQKGGSEWPHENADGFAGIQREICAAPPAGANRRRIFIVHGESGSGRGSLFHYLADNFSRKSAGGASYAWGLFTNANFSTEYSSVIDGAIHFLLRCRKTRDQLEDEASRNVLHSPALSRRDRVLKYLRDIYEPEANQRQGGRGLLVIGGAELLFRSQTGTAKNSEIVDALGAFLCPTTKTYDMDVVLICRSDKCPAIFGDSFKKVRSPNAQDNAEAEGRMSFGHDVEIVDERPRRISKPKPGRTRFDAAVLELKSPELDARIEEAFSRAGLAKRKRDSLVDSVKRAMSPALRRALQGRFSATIALQCALHVLEILGDEGLNRFLLALADAASKANPARSFDVVLAAVLSKYAELCRKAPEMAGDGGDDSDVAGPRDRFENAEKKLRLALEAVGAAKGTADGVPLSRIDADLFQLILKHVAMISGPVEVSVLARCPEISGRCEVLMGEIPKGKKARRPGATTHPLPHHRHHVAVAIVQNHLNWLVRRRLLFRLRERDEFSDAPNRERPPEIEGAVPESRHFLRYAAHQSLQGYFFHRIGAPFLELGDSRLFTVSMLAAPGRNLPSPSHSSFAFLISLLRELICYPQGKVQINVDREEWLRERDVCSLRAAVSLTRSAFPFSVVSRLSQFDSGNGKTERRFGVLEEYRVLLRWMIFQAGLLGDEKSKGYAAHLSRLGSGKEPSTSNFLRFRLNALYQDEITWLYNECGMVSLVQGNLFDAKALLDSAAESNQLIETGPEIGPNALRITVNQAVVQIERGNLNHTNDVLQAVELASGKEPTVFGVAYGYRGLVAHLRGRLAQADEHYNESIRLLREQGEARAISVFRKHLADLKRKHQDAKGSRDELIDALAEAESSRQHDQIYRVQVSLALCDLAEGSLTADVIRRVIGRLDTVIRYADAMEIPSLKAEALLARTKVIRLQGETRAAGDEAVAALAISTLHGQRLRAIVSLGLLGQVIADRPGHEAQGERLLRSASNMADAVGYQLAKADIGESLIGSAARDRK